MKDNLMGLELYYWGDSPRSKSAEWYRYRYGIKHNRPQWNDLVKALDPFFESCADHYEDLYGDNEHMNNALHTGTNNFTRGDMSLNLAQTVLDYFVDNGHVEILEQTLYRAIEKVKNSDTYEEMPYET
jgi:hypothetical protein